MSSHRDQKILGKTLHSFKLLAFQLCLPSPSSALTSSYTLQTIPQTLFSVFQNTSPLFMYIKSKLIIISVIIIYFSSIFLREAKDFHPSVGPFGLSPCSGVWQLTCWAPAEALVLSHSLFSQGNIRLRGREMRKMHFNCNFAKLKRRMLDEERFSTSHCHVILTTLY